VAKFPWPRKLLTANTGGSPLRAEDRDLPGIQAAAKMTAVERAIAGCGGPKN
jgi:hypothetical protein